MLVSHALVSAAGLPLPPYFYGMLTGSLFTGGDRGFLLGSFRQTPVGDFDEVWELDRRGDPPRLTRIYVDNPRRADAGRLYWGMPKLRSDVAISASGKLAHVSSRGESHLYALTCRENEERPEPTTLRIRCDALRVATLHLRASGWHDAILQRDGERIEGRALMISGPALLGAPELSEAQGGIQ